MAVTAPFVSISLPLIILSSFGDMMLFPLAFIVVSWCDGHPHVFSRALWFSVWIRQIFQWRPAVQNIAAHTNTFHSLDGPDSHTWAYSHTHTYTPHTPLSASKYCTCTHKTSPLTLTSLYTLCVMLCGLTEPAECVWLFVFLSSTDPYVNIPLQSVVTFTLVHLI